MGEYYWKYIDWYRLYFGEDTRNWFIILVIREIIEILFQVFAAFNYNGLNLFDKNEIVLAYQESDIKLFCFLLSMNCIIVGILWFGYIVAYKFCHGIFFKHVIFVLDTLFDTFYALFPIIVVTNQSGFDLQLAVGSLQTKNMYVIYYVSCVALCPMFSRLSCVCTFC